MKQGKIQQKILLLKVQNLDEKAFSAIYDLYINKIYRYIYFKVPNELDAEDLTSNVFLKMWHYLNSAGAREISNLNAFLYKIAHNLVIDYYRAKNEDILNIEAEILAQIQDKNNDLGQKIAINSDLEQILKALPGLKKEYREIILLKYVEELSTKEIAEVLAKKRGAVRILLHRALNTLKKIINEQNNSIS
jgi:RNA polymerase sigma-70 factor (ECF subfamily)